MKLYIMMRYCQYTIIIPVMLLMTLMFGAVVVGCVTGIGDVDDVPAVEAGVVTVPLVAAVVPVVEPVLVTVHTARNPVRGMEKSE